MAFWNRNNEFISPVMFDENGNEDALKTLQVRNRVEPMTLRERLFGRTLTQDVDMPTGELDKNGQAILETQRIADTRPGLLNDLANGYRENYNNRFSFDNLAPNQNKGLATRTGEFLGSVGRFIDSSLGRGLIAGGLNSALGYDNSLKEGLTAAVGRQNAQTADSLYRQQLAEQGIDTSDISGNVTDNVYQRLLHAKQLKDNEAYRRLYLDNQQKQQEIMQQYRQDQLDYQRKKDAEDRRERAEQRALTRRGQDLNYSLGQQRLNANRNKVIQNNTTMKTVNENAQALADIDAGLQLIEQNPQAYTWLMGKVGADIANRLDPKGVATRTQIDNITAVYRKWLTGAQMSDAERKAYERFLPAPTDNAQIVKSKLQGMKNSIERKNKILMQNVTMNNSADNDPLGIL